MPHTIAKWVYALQDTIASNAGEPQARTAPRFALILEDDDFDAKVTRDLLTGCFDLEITVERTMSLRDTLNSLQQTAYEIVLIDMNVPDSQGLDTVLEVLKATPTVPVVVLTGHDDTDTAIEALRLGAVDYLPKSSLDQVTLQRTVRFAIKRKEKEADLTYKAYYDSLTGLPNRAFLTERWRRCLALAAQAGKKVGVLVADLNRFKHINDRYGHNAGDLLLRQFAMLLTENVREGDMVARLGGDEFVVVVENVDNRGAVDGIRDTLSALSSSRFVYDGQIVPFSASFGATIADPAHDDDLVTVLGNADREMYAFKAATR